VRNVTVQAGTPFTALATLGPAPCAFARSISFTFNGLNKAAFSGLSGVAAVSFTAPNNSGVFPIQASFAGAGSCGPASGSGQVTVVGAPPATPTPVGAIPTATPGGPPLQGNVVLNPPSLAFLNQPVGGVSAPQTITLANNQNVALNVSSITFKRIAPRPEANLGDQFTETDNCVGVVQPQSACFINVSFAPTFPGLQHASLVVHDDLNATPQTALLNPQSVALIGGGLVAAKVTPSQVSFAARRVGTTSAPKPVRITNRLDAPISFTSVDPSGDFSVANNLCGSVLAPHASCKIGVAFTPTKRGRRKGSLTIKIDATKIPLKATLVGVGRWVHLWTWLQGWPEILSARGVARVRRLRRASRSQR
jgi:ASPM-SPD-2-Hydin domain-containing protein